MHAVDRYIIQLKVPGRRSAEIRNEKATEGFKSDNVLSRDISFQLSLCYSLIMRFWLTAITATLAASISAFPGPKAGALAATLGKRQVSKNGSSSLIVDLGYAQYQGMVDGATGLKTWKGYGCFCNQDQDESSLKS